LLTSPSLSTSTPASACLCTVSRTAARTSVRNCASSTGWPASCASTSGRNPAGRGRLPECVVKIRPVRGYMGPLRSPTGYAGYGHRPARGLPATPETLRNITLKMDSAHQDPRGIADQCAKQIHARRPGAWGGVRTRPEVRQAAVTFAPAAAKAKAPQLTARCLSPARAIPNRPRKSVPWPARTTGSRRRVVRRPARRRTAQCPHQRSGPDLIRRAVAQKAQVCALRPAMPGSMSLRQNGGYPRAARRSAATVRNGNLGMSPAPHDRRRREHRGASAIVA
jgi:hypothetical protein